MSLSDIPEVVIGREPAFKGTFSMLSGILTPRGVDETELFKTTTRTTLTVLNSFDENRPLGRGLLAELSRTVQQRRRASSDSNVNDRHQHRTALRNTDRL